jgi:hypothetical protein
MKFAVALFMSLFLLAGTSAQASDFKVVIGSPRQGPSKHETYEHHHQKDSCTKKNVVYSEKEFLPYLLSRLFFRLPNSYYCRSRNSRFVPPHHYCGIRHGQRVYEHKPDKHDKKKRQDDCGQRYYGHNKNYNYYK